MGGTFNDIVAFVAKTDLVIALRNELDRPANADIQQGAILSSALLITGLVDDLDRPDGQAWAESELPAIDRSLDGVVELADHEDYHRFGDGLVNRLFGGRADELEREIATSSGLNRPAASVVLRTTAWIVAGHLARLQDGGQDTPELVALLADEARDLRSAGWGPWLDEALAVPAPETSVQPEPNLESHSESPTPSDSAAGGAFDEKRGWGWTRAAIGLALLFLLTVGGTALFFATTGSDDDLASPAEDGDRPTSTDEPPVSPDEQPAAPSTTVAPASDGPLAVDTTEDAPADGESTEIPELVEYSLELSDPQQQVDAGGTVDLTLNTVTGEVCYEFDVSGLSAPYPAHIHIGPSAANGGITVDFGLLQPTDSGCVQAHPADLVAAATSPSVRYIEAHDPVSTMTIRGQLRAPDTAGPGPDPVVDITDVAHTAIVDGAVVLRGPVADQQTFDSLVASYADLDPETVPVVNELAVVPGADPPSGQVIVEGAVRFDFDSTALTEESNEFLAQLAEVLQARPRWRVAALGHTDSSGAAFYNFSLSLKRASVVQLALIDLGVPELHVTTEAFGPLIPLADNDSSAGRAQNRRIDFQIDTDQ